MKDVTIIPLFEEDGKTPKYPYDLLAEVIAKHDIYNEQRECKFALVFNRKWPAGKPGKVPKTHNVIIPKGVTAALAEELNADVIVELNEALFDLDERAGMFDDGPTLEQHKELLKLVMLQAVMEVLLKKDSNDVPVQPKEWKKSKPQNGRWFESVRALNGGKPLFEASEQIVRRRK